MVFYSHFWYLLIISAAVVRGGQEGRARTSKELGRQERGKGLWRLAALRNTPHPTGLCCTGAEGAASPSPGHREGGSELQVPAFTPVKPGGTARWC